MKKYCIIPVEYEGINFCIFQALSEAVHIPSPFQQLLMILTRLCLNFCCQDLSYRCKVHA